MGVYCAYCLQAAVLKSDTAVYHGNSYGGKVWHCEPCGAWVGVHAGTEKPLGRLANAELRAWKIKAHAAFDPMWNKRIGAPDTAGNPMGKAKARGKGYKWLAGRLGIEIKECHIGMFDVETCQRVVAICSEFYKDNKPPERCQK